MFGESYMFWVTLTLIQWAIVGLIFKINVKYNWNLEEQYFIIASIPFIGPLSIVAGIALVITFTAPLLVPYGIFHLIKKVYHIQREV